MGLYLLLSAEEQMVPRLFGLDLQLLFDSGLTLLAVFVLFLILSYNLFNPARKVLKNRSERIARDISEAYEDREEARKIREPDPVTAALIAELAGCNGITAHLDYLKNLGIDVIWVSPVYASPNHDNGYDISDYRAIMKEFGTMEDFDRMLSEIHARGMKRMAETVM